MTVGYQTFYSTVSFLWTFPHVAYNRMSVGVNFSIIHPLKVPIYKMQTFTLICVLEF
jgi:hypothetical protein